MKLPSYREILAMSKEKVDETLAPMRANTARKQAELEMAKLEEKIAYTQGKLNELCCQRDISFSEVIKLQDEGELLERRKAQYSEIIKQLFPDKESKK